MDGNLSFELRRACQGIDTEARIMDNKCRRWREIFLRDSYIYEDTECRSPLDSSTRMDTNTLGASLDTLR